MSPRFAISLLAISSALAQPAPRVPVQAEIDIRGNYTKYEYRIPVRDGIKLFTSVYIPKDVSSDKKT